MSADTKFPKEIPADTLKEIEAKHGEPLIVPTALGQVAFRQPRRFEYQRFQQKLMNEKTRHLAGEELVRSCVVFPDTVKAFDDLLEIRPFMITQCSNKLIEWAGQDGEPEEKKLGS